MKYRTEKDSLGEVKVPAKALWGAQTQRALDNFTISGIKLLFLLEDLLLKLWV